MGKLMNRIRAAIAKGLKSPLAQSAYKAIAPYAGELVNQSARLASRFGVPESLTSAASNFVIDKIAAPSSGKAITSFASRVFQPNAMIPSPNVADRTLAFLGDTPHAPSRPGGTLQFGTTQPERPMDEDNMRRALDNGYEYQPDKDILEWARQQEEDGNMKYDEAREKLLFDELIASEAGVDPATWRLLKKYNKKRTGGDAMRKQRLDKAHLKKEFEKSERRELKDAVRMYNRTGHAMHIAQNMTANSFGAPDMDKRIPKPDPTISTSGWYFKKQNPALKAAPGFAPVPASNLAPTQTIPSLKKPPAKKKPVRKFAAVV